TRITNLENKTEPNQLKVNAWVFVQDSDGSLGTKSFSGFGVSSVQRVSGNIYTISFSPALQNANYCAVATANDDTSGKTRLYANVPAKDVSFVQVRVKRSQAVRIMATFL